MSNRIAAMRAARERVDGIRENLGFPSKEYLDSMNDKQREGLFKLLHCKDTLIGASVISLAKNLYTSQARFVFELLQNAEDNDYSRALLRNETPQVTFHLYHDRVVQECNEDGFNEENLAAICNINKSSKKVAQTYIGEKGIGFKSVFIVAYKAYIQSGDYSFFFEHRPKDNGMGMIAPQWQETEEHPDDHLTRITLSLHDDATDAELAAQYNMIRKQFEQIHEAILLFMSKLKAIEIVFHHGKEKSEEIEKAVVFSIGKAGLRRTVTKTTIEDGETRTEERHYFATTYLASGLAKNKNRDYAMGDESYSRSHITLAFPLNDEDEPLLRPQWVFAYLPACQLGYKFIIQADFETQANREGIVTTAARNETLMLGIAEAFVHAVKEMRKFPSLRFKWMRYLPREDDYPWDETWSKVLTNIGKLLSEAKIMEPAEDGAPLKRLRESRKHTLLELDEHGNPIFADILPALYISPHYQRRDLEMLQSLSYTFMDEVINRARADLGGPHSRMKTGNDDLQSRISRLLTQPFNNGWLERQEEVMKLKMLQLQDGTWCAAYRKAVYFSVLDETDLTIPTGLGLNVLKPSAGLLPDKKHLMGLLGVKKAALTDIRKTIADIYGQYFEATPVVLSQAAHHLRFLYLTDHLAQDHGMYPMIFMISSTGARCSPSKMYIWNTDPDGVACLFAATPAGDNPGSGAPGRKVNFLHNSYVENSPGQPQKQSLDWKEWLHARFNIPRRIPLLSSDGTGLSQDCKYLAKYRPDRFLVSLQSTWGATKPNTGDEGNIIRELLDVRVVCRRGSCEKSVELGEAYLPLRKLTDLCDRFLLEEEFFAFLKISRPLSHGASPPEWEALGNSFGLGYNETDLVEFLLVVAGKIINAAGERDVESHPRRIYDLYLYLQSECRQSKDFEASCEKIRQSLLGETIFVPTYNRWADIRLCVWEAPGGLELQKKHSLTERFYSSFKQFETDKALMADLFVNILGLARTCTWQDLVDELRFRKEKGRNDFDSVHKLYECLSRPSPGSQSSKQLRNMFAEEALIYESAGGSEAWYKTSQCLWSSATNIRGMFAVNTLYDDLKPFFVTMLGVQTRTVGMVYKKLAGDTTSLPVDEIKTTLTVFSALLEREGGNFDPKPIVEKKLLPVMLPNGQVELRTAKQDFVIRDRQHLSDDFASKACFLDFNMESARRLQALITWAGLEDRYISQAIKEICSVDVSSTRPVNNVQLKVSPKAHALTRIAVTFDSPRLQGSVQALYRLFQSSQTFETDSITSRLIIHHSNPPVFVEKESANLYIPDDADELKIYLTNDEIEQESCFNTKLPRRLAQWIMSEPNRPLIDPAPPQMVAAVQSALSVSLRALPKVLDEHGILAIEVADEQGAVTMPLEISEREELTTVTTEFASLSLRGTSNRALVHREESLSNHSVQRSDTTTLGRRYSPIQASNHTAVHHEESPSNRSLQLSDTTTLGRSYSPIQVSDRTSHITDPHFSDPGPPSNSYVQLLSHVTEAAQRTIFPAYSRNVDGDAPELDGFLEPNYRENHFNLRQYHKLDRDKRVGAAGELFVFEVLLRLLPNFDISNWKSTIRHMVNEHSDYNSIGRWHGQETSDIVYRDTRGVLTNLLIENGYMEGQQWTESTIEYYVEVKTTTDSCKKPFYMGNSQYERMHRYSLANPSFWNVKKLYLVFRVFDLTQSSIGLKVLVDPASLSTEGLVSFTPDTWLGVIH